MFQAGSGRGGRARRGARGGRRGRRGRPGAAGGGRVGALGAGRARGRPGGVRHGLPGGAGRRGPLGGAGLRARGARGRGRSRRGGRGSYLPPQLPGLPFNPFKALLVPRPIAWVSTRGDGGDNLSPYSFFGHLAPDVVFFGAGGAHADGGEKDALRDARSSGVFCVNAVPWELRLAMSASAAEAPRGEDEFELAAAPGCLAGAARPRKGACARIDAPCVANAPLRLECRVLALVAMAEALDVAVVGQVLHVAGEGLGGAASGVAARGGYHNYFRVAAEHTLDPFDAAAAW
ncbi:unnamed protein product [Prorocentrum cordatum]|uniref:Flavin reductase like domain-containing protein n=1 Tax=Prorocentrum cordatum TaxID=2364126 RepID=A0ABN9U5N5_9DINO|nr:unnamed protein product [Polarella glacialis]